MRSEVWNPYIFLRIFLPLKTTDLTLFFKFSQIRTHFEGVSCLKNGWFKKFFVILVQWVPLLRIFLTKMGPLSKEFWWKTNPFGRHIPVCLNMWVPPRVIITLDYLISSFSSLSKQTWLYPLTSQIIVFYTCATRESEKRVFFRQIAFPNNCDRAKMCLSLRKIWILLRGVLRVIFQTPPNMSSKKSLRRGKFEGKNHVQFLFGGGWLQNER